MDIIVERAGGPERPRRVEVVERKGAGHPDTICDSLAEAASAALCRWYETHFGQVLHHNLDKVLLRGGAAAPAFGGGEVTKPIEVYIAGRATAQYGGADVPVEALVVEACRAWFRDNMRAVDGDRHLRVHCLVRPGSIELAELFRRAGRAGVPLANDSSCGVGFFPLSAVEKAVLEVDAALSGPAAQRACPALGEDIKIMAVRRDDSVALTIAAALIGKHVPGMDGYRAAKMAIADRAMTAGDFDDVVVNAADDPARGSIYLTVTGTSAEAGDDGEVGRGNRANGLITPYRPMTMEAVAGKNPVSHVGKIYNLAATRIAERIVAAYPDLGDVHCLLVSRIGAPIDRPQLVHVWSAGAAAKAMPTAGIERIVGDSLGRLPQLIRAPATPAAETARRAP
jgi:S-adenosylmethionine synthetase